MSFQKCASTSSWKPFLPAAFSLPSHSTTTLDPLGAQQHIQPDPLANFSRTYTAGACSYLPPDIPCITTFEDLACGTSPTLTHLDLLIDTNLVNVVVPTTSSYLVPNTVCLAPDVNLHTLTPLGFWDGWEMQPSPLSGHGSHATQSYPKDACLGRAVRVYSPNYFNDFPTVAGVNHCTAAPNLVFVARPDEDLGLVHLFLRTSRAVLVGEELCANYASPDCPRPNFVNHEPYEPFPFP